MPERDETNSVLIIVQFFDNDNVIVNRGDWLGIWQSSTFTDVLSCHCFHFKNKASERKNNYVLLPFFEDRGC